MHALSQSLEATHVKMSKRPALQLEPQPLPPQSRELNTICRSVTVPYGKSKLFTPSDRRLLQNYDLKETDMKKFPELTFKKMHERHIKGKHNLKHQRSKQHRNHTVETINAEELRHRNGRDTIKRDTTVVNNEEEDPEQPTFLLEDIVVDYLYRRTHTRHLTQAIMRTEPLEQPTRSRNFLPRLSRHEAYSEATPSEFDS